MKRTFTDLHLLANLRDQTESKRIIERASEFGYTRISTPASSKITREGLTYLKDLSKEAGLDFVSRVDFRPRNETELTHFLRRFRRCFEVICILCDTKEIARQAAKDRRVDLVNFPSIDYHRRFFDRAEAELAHSSIAAFEVDIKPLLILDGPPRIRLLTSLRREVDLACEFKVPLILSSGTEEFRLMRFPKDMASVAYLFGMDEATALDAISTNPEEIVKRNRKKLSERFIAPGISIVEGGKNQ